MTENTKPGIYFAHPFEKQNSYEKKNIIQKLSKWFKVIDPFKEEKELEQKYGSSYYGLSKEYGKTLNPELYPVIREFSTEIVNKDFNQLMDCEAYFGWFPVDSPHRMIGTSIEVSWARRYERHPIIIIDNRFHPFLLCYADVIFTDINHFAKNINKWMKDNYKKNKNQEIES